MALATASAAESVWPGLLSSLDLVMSSKEMDVGLANATAGCGGVCRLPPSRGLYENAGP